MSGSSGARLSPDVCCFPREMARLEPRTEIQEHRANQRSRVVRINERSIDDAVHLNPSRWQVRDGSISI